MSETLAPRSGRMKLALALTVGIGVALPGVGQRNCPPVRPPTPAPPVVTEPSPTPSPQPTPEQLVTPPQTVPEVCKAIGGATKCTSTGPAYQGEVTAALAKVLGVEVGSAARFDAAQQKAATIAVMEVLEGQGFCTSYDLESGNSGLNSEMGVRRRDGADFADWFQPFASVGYVRWSGMYRTTCRPAADAAQLAEVRTLWAPVQGAGRCPLTVDEDHPLQLKVVVRQGAAGAVWLDATYEYYFGVNADGINAGPCGDPRTHAPRRWCDLGVDGGPDGEVCADELGGDPVFTSLDPGLQLEPGFRDNPYLARAIVTRDEIARARVCSPKRPSVCAEVRVQ